MEQDGDLAEVRWPYPFPPMAGASEDDPGTAGEGTAESGSEGAGGGELSKPSGHSWFGRLVAPFRAADDPESEVSRRSRGSNTDTSGDDGAGSDEKPVGQEAKAGQDGAEPKGGEGDDEKPFAVFATKEDLDRAVQAETDRREAVRSLRQQNEARMRLRKDDPEAFIALEDREKAEREALSGIAGQVIDVYDTEILAPLLARLPDDKRAEISQTINSVDTRKAAAEAVLKHIEDEAFKRGQDEGEKKANVKLRQNPAVRKELLSELRGDQDGIDLVEAGAGSGSGGKSDMNAWLRRSARVA